MAKKKKNKLKIILWFAVVLVVALSLCGFLAVRWYYDNRMPNFTKSYTFFIYPDTTPDQAVNTICTGAGAIRRGSLQRSIDKECPDGKICPGKYVINPGDPAIYVARMLHFGWQKSHSLTLSGTIRSKGRLAQQISRQMMVDSSTVAELLDSAQFLQAYGFTPENVFALFLPDTYEIYWTASPDEIFSRFKAEYDSFWTQERVDLAAAQKLSPMQASILASIVCGETNAREEYATIAGVYLNRLHGRMKLQADPTVAFCFNYEVNRILNKHLKVDSPYNTYKYYGLPPAPINIPQKAAIDAVISPENHKYLFFCANPNFNGTHIFAATYSEHLKNARAFQKALDARQAKK